MFSGFEQLDLKLSIFFKHYFLKFSKKLLYSNWAPDFKQQMKLFEATSDFIEASWLLLSLILIK